MTKGDIKRKQLFDKYSSNLHFLVLNDKVPENIDVVDDSYICPICLKSFLEIDLDQDVENPLSLEDAPPKSLGGSQIVLTCEECNNGMGKDIDWHLTERLRELDFHHFYVGAEQTGTMTIDGISVNVSLTMQEGRQMEVYLSKKNNNPKKTELYINKLKELKNAKPFWKPRTTRVNSKKLQIALLKNAYLLLFQKFGYAFLFVKEYDRVREQLLNPEKDIYPLDCWFEGPFPKDKIGVPFITEKNLESIFTLFELKTKLSSRLFGVVLPLSNNKIETTIKALREKFEKNDEFSVQMMSFTDDYLANLESINLLLNYMDNGK